MNKKWIIGSVVGVHVVGVSIMLISSGCSTVNSEPGKTSAVQGRKMPPTTMNSSSSANASSRKSTTFKPKSGSNVAWQEPTTKYVIKSGDTLSGIASKYSLSARDIADLNKITDPNKIRPGQTIMLPGKVDTPASKKNSTAKAPKKTTVAALAGASEYRVKSGDCLSVIAQQHGVKTAELRKANGLSDDVIRVGQVLAIPAGGTAKTAGTKPATKSAVIQKMPELNFDDIPVAPTTKPAPKPVKKPATVVVPATVPVSMSTDLSPSTGGGARGTGGYRNYVVEKDNETLYMVAIKWKAVPEEIKRVNGLSDNPTLYKGQELKIPIAR